MSEVQIPVGAFLRTPSRERPAAKIEVLELEDSYIALEAYFWIADPARAEVTRIRSEFIQQVTERFDAEGIEMPYPARELTGSIGTWEDEAPTSD